MIHGGNEEVRIMQKRIQSNENRSKNLSTTIAAKAELNGTLLFVLIKKGRTNSPILMGRIVIAIYPIHDMGKSNLWFNFSVGFKSNPNRIDLIGNWENNKIDAGSK